jgi:hypothetical protein
MSVRTVEKPKTVVEEVDAKVCEQCGVDETELDLDDASIVKAEYYAHNPSDIASTDWTPLPEEDRYLCPDCTDVRAAHKSLVKEKMPDGVLGVVLGSLRDMGSELFDQLLRLLPIVVGVLSFAFGLFSFYIAAGVETKFENGFHAMLITDAAATLILAFIPMFIVFVTGVLIGSIHWGG